MERHWFVFYTKSRQEKKVHDLLVRKGYHAFLPLQKVVRQWSDRKKKVEVPLFNSYIFVKDYAHKINDILQIPGISWNIRHNGKPAILRNEEIELINRLLETGFSVEATAFDSQAFSQGEKTIIIDGPLKGVQGVVLGLADHQSFNIALEGIDQLIRVQIPAFLLKKL